VVRPSVGVHAPPRAAYVCPCEASNYSTYTLNPSRPLTSRPQPALGQAIRELRQKRGETQEELAPRCEISPKTLSLIERGEANPTWATVRDISTALGVSIGELAKLSEKHE
jgi:DNA-binding XRE family transcriptional regulator